MGKTYDKIDGAIQRWIVEQKVFFVATAPLSEGGHINCSPKDGYSIRVCDEKTLVYLDLIGSGVETIAHLRENGRIVVSFCRARVRLGSSTMRLIFCDSSTL